MENLVKSKIRTLYPDADFSSISSGDLIVFKELIQDRLTKSKFDDNITHVKLEHKGYKFDKVKEPYLNLSVKFQDKQNNLINDIDLFCYAFDVMVANINDEKLYNIFLKSWNEFMISKFKREYCDGLSNYILAWRVRNGEDVAETASKRMREALIAKYSIEKEETNQP